MRKITKKILNHGSFNKHRSKTYNKEIREVEEDTILANAEVYPTNHGRDSN